THRQAQHLGDVLGGELLGSIFDHEQGGRVHCPRGGAGLQHGRQIGTRRGHGDQVAAHHDAQVVAVAPERLPAVGVLGAASVDDHVDVLAGDGAQSHHQLRPEAPHGSRGQRLGHGGQEPAGR
ncbi:hypothetical protein C4884_10905, partial [Streptococcus agalactiae]